MNAQIRRQDQGERGSDSLLKVLTWAQIRRIDDLLHQLGPFGELRLIKKKGRLRFVKTVESVDLSE